MADENSTIVGESITIKGEISGDQDLILHGIVEGEINLSRDLIIKPPSKTHANVKARNITVSGRLEGNCEGEQKVELAADGSMIGDIQSPRVVIVDGAYFKGTIDMGDEKNRPAQATGASDKPDKDKGGNAKNEDADKKEDGEKDNRRMQMPDYLVGKKK